MTRFLHLYKSNIVDIICYLYMLLFSYAAISKLMVFEKFKAQIGQSSILTSFSDYIAIFIPAIELVIAIMLGFPRLRKKALFFSYYLMTLFTIYIIAVLGFSDRVPCSCGGILEKLGWTEHIFFNLIFVGLAILGIVWTKEDRVKSQNLNLISPKPES